MVTSIQKKWISEEVKLKWPVTEYHHVMLKEDIAILKVYGVHQTAELQNILDKNWQLKV